MVAKPRHEQCQR